MPVYDSLSDMSYILKPDKVPSAGIPGNFGPSANAVGLVDKPSSIGFNNAPGEMDAAESGLVQEPSSDIKTSVDSALEGGWSLSDFMKNNPGAGYEQIMNEASHHSDEFAEKYLDYLVERGELDRANAYTAEREDTAYQRLVSDLKKAGLNPAMMYGGSASTSSSGSQGYIKMVEGANSRSISNYDKLKRLLLGFLSYELEKGLGIANSVIDGVGTLAKFINPLMALFGV